jgi:hypothetical protein
MCFGPPIKNLLETHLKPSIHGTNKNFQKEEQNQQNTTFKMLL